MSQWNEPTIDDMGIDPDDPTKLIIIVDPDYSGNVYAEVKIADIKEILKKKLKWMRPSHPRKN